MAKEVSRRGQWALIWEWVRTGDVAVVHRVVLEEWIELLVEAEGDPLWDDENICLAMSAMAQGTKTDVVWEAVLMVWLGRWSRAWQRNGCVVPFGGGSPSSDDTALARVPAEQLAEILLVAVNLQGRAWRQKSWGECLLRVLPASVIGLDTAWPMWVRHVCSTTQEDWAPTNAWRTHLARAAGESGGSVKALYPDQVQGPGGSGTPGRPAARMESGGGEDAVGRAGCVGVEDSVGAEAPASSAATRPDPVAVLRARLATLVEGDEDRTQMERGLKARGDWTPEGAAELMKLSRRGALDVWQVCGAVAPLDEAIQRGVDELRPWLQSTDIAQILRLGRDSAGRLSVTAVTAICAWMEESGIGRIAETEGQDGGGDLLRQLVSEPQLVGQYSRPLLRTLIRDLRPETRRRLLGTLATLRTGDSIEAEAEAGPAERTPEGY